MLLAIFSSLQQKHRKELTIKENYFDALTSEWTQCGIKTVNNRKEWYIENNECYCVAMIQALSSRNNNNIVPSMHFLLRVFELRGFEYPNLQSYSKMGQN